MTYFCYLTNFFKIFYRLTICVAHTVNLYGLYESVFHRCKKLTSVVVTTTPTTTTMTKSMQ